MNDAPVNDWIRGEELVARVNPDGAVQVRAAVRPLRVNHIDAVQWHEQVRAAEWPHQRDIENRMAPQPMHRLDDEAVAEPILEPRRHRTLEEEMRVFEERNREEARLHQIAAERERYLAILQQMNEREEQQPIERMLRDGD